MTNVESLYKKIGALLMEASLPYWTEIFLSTLVLGKDCSRMVTEQIDTHSKRSDIDINFSTVFELSAAIINLRDGHLRATGKRIWGLTFTLYPDGKYNIAYDYNKPEDYDDSGEEVSTPNSSPVGDLLGGLVNPSDTPTADTFIQQALKALQDQTARNTATWGLGTEVQWNLDMNAGRLFFTFADGKKLSAAVQVVGTYNTANSSFFWGWEHPSVPEPLRRAAHRARDYGQAHDIEALTTRTTSCTQADAWNFTAVAAELDGAAGAYRGDAGGTWVYLVFEEPTTSV